VKPVYIVVKSPLGHKIDSVTCSRRPP
jgi:hypothetical protein